MRNPAIPRPRTTCPTWCTNHQTDHDGHTHAAAPAVLKAGTVTMTQITEPSAAFPAQDQPTIWLDDEPLTPAAAAELSAILTAMVAEALASVAA